MPDTLTNREWRAPARGGGRPARRGSPPAPAGGAECKASAPSRGARLPSGAVLLVADVLAPGHGRARLVVLVDGDVSHEAVGGGAVPVVLAGLEEDAVAGPDLLDRPAFALAPADALDDEDGMA